MTLNDRLNRTGSTSSFLIMLTVQFVIALVAMQAPFRRLPVDFRLILWLSLPLAGVWVAGSVGSLFYFGRRALWILLSAPFALYWPVWFLFNRIPICYWRQNCI